MKNTLEGINSRLNGTEKCISDLEDRIMETAHLEQWKEKQKQILKSKDSLRDHWDNIRCTNIHIIGVAEGGERERGKNVFDEIMAENFLSLKKETDFQVQKTQKIPNKMNPRVPQQDIS